MIDNLFCKSIWPDKGVFDKIKKSSETEYVKSDYNNRGYYQLYKFKGLSIKLYEEYKHNPYKFTSHNLTRGIEVSGSIRKYYCDKRSLDKYSYDLSLSNIKEIITDLSNIGLNTDDLRIIGLEFGLVLDDDGNVLNDMIHLPYFNINTFGSNSIEFLSSRKNERYVSRKLIFYKPEVNYRLIKENEPSNLLRIEFNIPKRMSRVLDLKNELNSETNFNFTDLGTKETLELLYDYLRNQLMKIKCIQTKKEDETLTTSNDLARLAISSQDAFYRLKLYIDKYKSLEKLKITKLKDYQSKIINQTNNKFEEKRDLLDALINKFDDKFNSETAL